MRERVDGIVGEEGGVARSRFVARRIAVMPSILRFHVLQTGAYMRTRVR